MNSDLKNITVTTKQLADFFGVSEGYISDLVNDYNMPKIKFNEFNLFDCVKFRIDHLEKIYQDKIKKHDDYSSKGRIDAANARIRELELAEKERTLAPVEQFGTALANEVNLFKKGFQAIHWVAKFGLSLNETQLAEIQKHIDSILIQMSEIPSQMRAENVIFKDAYDKEIKLN